MLDRLLAVGLGIVLVLVYGWCVDSLGKRRIRMEGLQREVQRERDARERLRRSLDEADRQFYRQVLSWRGR